MLPLAPGPPPPPPPHASRTAQPVRLVGVPGDSVLRIGDGDEAPKRELGRERGIWSPCVDSESGGGVRATMRSRYVGTRWPRLRAHSDGAHARRVRRWQIMRNRTRTHAHGRPAGAARLLVGDPHTRAPHTAASPRRACKWHSHRMPAVLGRDMVTPACAQSGLGGRPGPTPSLSSLRPALRGP